MICENCGNKYAFKLVGKVGEIKCNKCSSVDLRAKVTPAWLKKGKEFMGEDYEIVPPDGRGGIGGVFYRGKDGATV